MTEDYTHVWFSMHLSGVWFSMHRSGLEFTELWYADFLITFTKFSVNISLVMFSMTFSFSLFLKFQLKFLLTSLTLCHVFKDLSHYFEGDQARFITAMRWHWKEQYCEIEIILMSEFVQRVLQTFN